jgi:pimeloyl-ACP methyl ester carboxylesterase
MSLLPINKKFAIAMPVSNNHLWNPAIDPTTEPAQIAIARGEWFDAARGNRKIAYKTYTPVERNDGPFPVIIWSHGLGGSRDGGRVYLTLCRIPRLCGGAYPTCGEPIPHCGKEKQATPWDVIRATHIPRKATLQRLRDVPFVLSQLPTLDIASQMDLSRLGMSGHSFGGMTTQVMAGQRRGYGVRQYDLHEPRFKAGIVYSPVPFRQKRGHPPRSLLRRHSHSLTDNDGDG